jgi:hypothetical protein
MAAEQQKQDYDVAASNLATKYAALKSTGDALAAHQQQTQQLVDEYNTAASDFLEGVEDVDNAAQALKAEYDTFLPT